MLYNCKCWIMALSHWVVFKCASMCTGLQPVCQPSWFVSFRTMIWTTSVAKNLFTELSGQEIFMYVKLWCIISREVPGSSSLESRDHIFCEALCLFQHVCNEAAVTCWKQKSTFLEELFRRSIESYWERCPVSNAALAFWGAQHKIWNFILPPHLELEIVCFWKTWFQTTPMKSH